MKKITLLAMVSMVFFILPAGAQTFQNFIGKTTPVEFGNSVAIGADTAYVIAGSYKNTYFASNHFPVLMRLYKDGTVQWTKQFNITGSGTGSGEARYNDAVKNSSGAANGHITLIYKYPNLYVVRTNNPGAVLWGRQISNGSFSSNYALRIKTVYNTNGSVNGFLLLATHFGNDGEILMKLNSTGSTVWQKSITHSVSGSKYVFRDMQVTSDGGCIVTGYQEASTSNAILFKFASSGGVTWAKSYDFFSTPYAGGFGVAVTPTGYAVTGSENGGFNLTFSTNTSGTVSWANKYSSTSISEMHSNSIVSDASGNLIFGGHNLLTTTPAFFVKTNSAGTVTFGKTYYFRVGMNDIKLSPQGYCAVGTSDNYSTPEDIYIINTNTSGNIASSCTPTTVTITRTSPEFTSQVNAAYTIANETMTNAAVTVSMTNISTSQSWCGAGAPEAAAATDIKVTGKFSAFADWAGHTIKLEYKTSGNDNNTYVVTLYNINGMAIAKKEIAANALSTLSAGDLQDGLYVAILTQNGGLLGKQNVLWGK